MEVRELERIKKIISDAELKAAKADGVIEKIKAEWKSDFGVDTLEGAETELEKISEQIKTQTARQKELLKELEALTDWEALEDQLS